MKNFTTPAKGFAFACAAASACVLGAPLMASAQTALLSYDFNETGTQAFAQGSAATAGAPVLNITGDGAARGAAGSGVSGAPGDLAFDNTDASGFFDAGRAEHDGDFDPIDSLSAFTLTGWFQLPDTATESIGRQDSLIENINFLATSPTRGGFGLTGSARADDGGLRLRVNEVSGVESDPGTYDEIGEYVFFAVTYNGSEVNFYKGLTDETATLVDTVAYNQGPVVDESQPLLLGVSTGGSSLQQNPFNGLIDNVGIYDDVLDPVQIESLRQSAVPEPASLGLLALGGLMLRRRR